ncbi:hypothetical protein PTTG_00080 [Puccinia triticina 1-1 BBBD Race 1]|uniref:Uncharacterized protein n=1 Tax=Puccinia triticina (isolate 1-1 / race 1 (BBBD)) TaxID=630390 RepID=A0A0C4EH64_PUCT1|nr:hypothetical protein PTTG_00080 [Puccinia triticina 1-1 BBBD Race 1]
MIYSRLFQCLVLVILSVTTIPQALADPNPQGGAPQPKPAPQPQPKPSPQPKPGPQPKPAPKDNGKPCAKDAVPVCIISLDSPLAGVETHHEVQPQPNKEMKCDGSNRNPKTPATDFRACCGKTAIPEARKKKTNKKWRDLCAAPGDPIPNFQARTPTSLKPAPKPKGK